MMTSKVAIDIRIIHFIQRSKDLHKVMLTFDERKKKIKIITILHVLIWFSNWKNLFWLIFQMEFIWAVKIIHFDFPSKTKICICAAPVMAGPKSSQIGLMGFRNDPGKTPAL